MTRVISFANQKGGVAKTTSAINIAACLALNEKRVLLVDMDPQTDSTRSCGLEEAPAHTIYTAFDETALIKKAIITTAHGFDLLIGDAQLSKLSKETDDVFIFRDTLQVVKGNYDYILIDLPPDVDYLFYAGLSAATDVLIPLQPEVYATAGMEALRKTIDGVKHVDRQNPHLNVLGAFVTMYQSVNAHKNAVAAAKEYCAAHGIRLFETIIRRSIKFNEANEVPQPAVLAFPRNAAVQAYLRLTEEAFGA